MPLVLIGIAPLLIYFYCLLKYPKGTIIVSVISFIAFGVQQCSVSKKIVGEPESLVWITPEGVTGYPYKQVKIKVSNLSGDFYSSFELKCATQNGSITFRDRSGIMAKASETRTYKLDETDSGVSEITNCAATSVNKGKPNSEYDNSNWSY